MKSRKISRSKTGLFSLACTDPYIGIGWEYQSRITAPDYYITIVYVGKTGVKLVTRGLLVLYHSPECWEYVKISDYWGKEI